MQKTTDVGRLKEATASERRGNRRVVLAFQIEVSGKDRGGIAFQDETTTIDISEDGCRFPSERKLHVGDHLSLGLVNTEFARSTGQKTQLFEVVWVESGRSGWTIGVKKLESQNIWPMTFPI